jgi:hypothetical protein
VLCCLLLLATAGLALGRERTKSCAHINHCGTVLRSTPPPTVTFGGQPAPASRFGVVVRTAPTPTATTGQSGKLVTEAELGRHITCRGYRLKAPSTFEFKLLTATPVNITYEITDRITNATVDGTHFCLAANFPFKTLSGRQAPPARLPDGTRGHIGLLPNCPRPLPPAGATTAPCVVRVTTTKNENSSTGVDVILRVRVPTRTKGDPWGGS